MAVAGFNPSNYLAANPDLITAGYTVANAEQHYIAYGQREGRSTSFNAAGYLASYADLRAAFGTNTEAATQHYLSSGRTEGRDITFDGLRYLASNTDLINAGLRTAEQAAQHYISYGASESRSAARFHAGAYALANSDLYYAMGNGDSVNSRSWLTQHYIDNGAREGRYTTPTDWTGRGTLSSAVSSYQERQFQLPAGRYQVDMVGAPSGQGTLADPYVDIGLERFGRATVTTDNDSGFHKEARATFTVFETGTYSIRFGQATAGGGSFMYSIAVS